MQRNFSISVALLSTIVVCATARSEDPLPKRQAPSMVVAKLAEGGGLAIRRVVFVAVNKTEVQKITVTELRTEIVGGRAVAKPVAIEKEVPVVTTSYEEQVRESRLATDAFFVRDLDGKKLDPEALAKALATEKPVLLAENSKPLDPFYAAFFKPGTLVVHLNADDDKSGRPVPVPLPAFDPAVPRPVPKPLPAAPVEIKIAPPPPPPAVPSSKPPK
jgi:hypothetical protein